MYIDYFKFDVKENVLSGCASNVLSYRLDAEFHSWSWELLSPVATWQASSTPRWCTDTISSPMLRRTITEQGYTSRHKEEAKDWFLCVCVDDENSAF